MRAMIRTSISLIVIVWLATGCAAPQTPLPTAESLAPTVDAAATTPPTPILAPTPLPPDAPQTITLWVLDLVFPPENTELWRLFEQQIAAFEATRPNVNVEVLLKKRDGKGGLIDMLSTASAVAPALVPDLLVLDTQALIQVTRDGLIVALDDALPPELLIDLYPFAVAACTVEGQLVGAQFQANIQHAVYNTSKIAVPPLTWDEVFASGATYVFPMAGQDGLVNEAFLLQYLSTGAVLLGEDDNPALDPVALADVLTFYQQGIASGVILTDALSYQKIEDAWPKYLQAGVVISNLSSNLYLSGRSLLEPVSLATSIPTRDGTAVALSRGYAWAVAARDANRQALAFQLLEWLMYTPYLVASNQASGHLPTRRSAFEQMQRDAYTRFMYAQLESTYPYPTSELHLRIYRAMQTAIDDVLHKNVSPEEAAANVLKAVGQGAAP